MVRVMYCKYCGCQVITESEDWRIAYGDRTHYDDGTCLCTSAECLAKFTLEQEIYIQKLEALR